MLASSLSCETERSPEKSNVKCVEEPSTQIGYPGFLYTVPTVTYLIDSSSDRNPTGSSPVIPFSCMPLEGSSPSHFVPSKTLETAAPASSRLTSSWLQWPKRAINGALESSMSSRTTARVRVSSTEMTKLKTPQGPASHVSDPSSSSRKAASKETFLQTFTLTPLCDNAIELAASANTAAASLPGAAFGMITWQTVYDFEVATLLSRVASACASMVVLISCSSGAANVRGMSSLIAAPTDSAAVSRKPPNSRLFTMKA
mmetsp:Transcript_2101/g.3933  ORF Transcript_2101/g.3933 Transcript_2101/m.3933 type:complete len:258 (+) Transcript_2101:337-1110(+)